MEFATNPGAGSFLREVKMCNFIRMDFDGGLGHSDHNRIHAIALYSYRYNVLRGTWVLRPSSV